MCARVNPYSITSSPNHELTIATVGLIWPSSGFSFFLILFHQEIDGNALLLLKSDMIMKYLGLKLGPALKLCYHIDKLKQAKFWRFLKGQKQSPDNRSQDHLPYQHPSHLHKMDFHLKNHSHKDLVFLLNVCISAFLKIQRGPSERLLCVNDLPKKK